MERYKPCPKGYNGGWNFKQTTQPNHPGAIKRVSDLKPNKQYCWVICQMKPRGGAVRGHLTNEVTVVSVHNDHVVLRDSENTFKADLAQLGLAPKDGVWHTCQRMIPLSG